MKRNKNKHTIAGQKTVIKRVARRKKRATTQEKVLGALGVGSALVGGVSGVAPKAPSTQFVRAEERSAASKTGKVRETLSRVFGIREAKASEWDPGADLKIGQIFPEGIMAGNANLPAPVSQANPGGSGAVNQGTSGGSAAQNSFGAAGGVRSSVTDVSSDGEFEGTEEEGAQGAGQATGGTGSVTNQGTGLRPSGSEVSDDDGAGGGTQGGGQLAGSVRPSVSEVSDDDGFTAAGFGSTNGSGTGTRNSVTGVSSNDGEVEVLDESAPGSAGSLSGDGEVEVLNESLPAQAGNDDEVEVREESAAPAGAADDGEIEVLNETAPGPGGADDEVEVQEEAAAQPVGTDDEVEVLDESAPPTGTGDEEVEGTEDQAADEQEIENEEVDANSGGSGSEDEEVEVLHEAGETAGGGSASGGTGGSGGGTVGTQTSFSGTAALGTAPSGLRYDDIVRAQQPSGLRYADLVNAQQPSGLRYSDIAPAQGTANVTASGATYTVRPGDTLSAISQRYYGDASRWREIFEANLNVVQNPRLLRVGSVLVIPGALPGTPSPSVAGAAPAGIPSGGAYTVKRGDTLWDLAGRFYGDGRAWTTLRDANAGKFSDQYSLGVGTRLAVPANVTSRAAPPTYATQPRARPPAPRVTAAASAPVTAAHVAPVEQPIVRPSVTDVGSDDEVEGTE